MHYKEDTLWFPCSFEIHWAEHRGLDTFPDYNRFMINREWEPATEHTLLLVPGAFTDIYGITHDTAEVSFKTYELEHYGNMMLELSNVNTSLIIQLFNKEDKKVREKYVDGDGTVHFNYIHPGKNYTLKIIFDRNQNRRWDTGDYAKKRQPEKVIFNNRSIEIREGWDIELVWELGQ
jgi:hypothetical protein